MSQICFQYHVAKLELFGSATGENFDEQQSDLDFLVEFQAIPLANYADYFGLKYALEDLFKRSVDLVEPKAIKNSYVLKQVLSQKKLLYAALS